MLWSRYGKTSYVMQPHRHDLHEFFVCLNEHGVQHVEGRSCGFKRGRAFMLFSGCRHWVEFRPEALAEFILVCFDKNHLAQAGYLRLQEQLENHRRQGAYFSGDAPDYLEFNVDAITRLHRTISTPGLLQNELVNALLAQLLIAFLRSTVASDLSPEEDKKRSGIVKLCRQATADPTLEMTLAQAARKAGVCRSAFAALVKQTTGFTWRQYILDCRLKKAVELLATTDIPISDVALKCNFGNLGYFYRTFLWKYDCTPRKMRLLLQQSSFPPFLKEY
ncbi:MAG: helix-turn-helix transcriptional regulator [Victivallaceae bacterium]|nr:helix-turn-helix transcriptional regulator [Victivallaceae bacterium]